MAEIIFRRHPSELGAAIRGAASDLSDLLDLIGARLKAASDLAFKSGQWDGERWADQYPNTPPSRFANVAGILERLNRGRPPLSRQFHRKTPLRGTSAGGGLLGSISAQKTGPASVTIGTTKEYAAQQFFGLMSRQPVTETAKTTLRQWMRSGEGRQFGGRIDWLLDADELETQINARQFLGITRIAAKRIRKDAEDFFAGRLTSGDS